jgi:hypothetical protein
LIVNAIIILGSRRSKTTILFVSQGQVVHLPIRLLRGRITEIGFLPIMSGYYSDTHPKMEELQVKLLREVPAYRKMEMLISLNASAQELALAGLRRRFPNASQNELRRRLADILLGRDLARKVYGEPEYAG